MSLMIRDQRQPSGLVEWVALTVDCPDPNSMADFYAALLGGPATSRTPGQATVDVAGGPMYFRAAPNYKPPTWPSPEVPLHQHFEYVVEDPHATAQQLIPVGASLAGHKDPDDPNLVVMLDQAGPPFCLIQVAQPDVTD